MSYGDIASIKCNYVTHSALYLGLIGLVRFLPLLVFSLIAGSVADSYNRKKLLYITSTALTILAAALAYFTITKTITPEIIFIITVGSATFTALDMPARQAYIPGLVERKYLPNAVSIFSIFFQVATILGPAVAGIIIAKSFIGAIYAFNSVSFLAVVIGLFFVKASGEIIGEKTKISLGSIKEGLVFIRTRTMIWSTMLLDFFSTFFSGATALLPIFATDILHVGPIGLGLLYAGQSIGALIAGIVVAHKREIRRQGFVLLTSVGFYALGTIVFGFSKTFIISFIALIVLGAGDGVSTIIRNTIRQLETPDYIRGRMSSINVIFFMGGPQLGDFEAGALANAIGAPASVVLGGVGTLAVIAVMAAKIPKLRNYDRHEDSVVLK